MRSFLWFTRFQVLATYHLPSSTAFLLPHPLYPEACVVSTFSPTQRLPWGWCSIKMWGIEKKKVNRGAESNHFSTRNCAKVLRQRTFMMLGFHLCYKKICLKLCPASYLPLLRCLHVAIARCVVGFHTSWWLGVSFRPWTMGMTEGAGGRLNVWAKGSIQGVPSFSTTFWKSSKRGWQPERGSRWELTSCLLMGALLSWHREKTHLVSEWLHVQAFLCTNCMTRNKPPNFSESQFSSFPKIGWQCPSYLYHLLSNETKTMC